MHTSKTTKYTTNWSQPLAFISELLRVEQGYEKVAAKTHSDDEDNERCRIHGLPQVLAGAHVE
jgi:hypothetical protein